MDPVLGPPSPSSLARSNALPSASGGKSFLSNGPRGGREQWPLRCHHYHRGVERRVRGGVGWPPSHSTRRQVGLGFEPTLGFLQHPATEHIEGHPNPDYLHMVGVLLDPVTPTWIPRDFRVDRWKLLGGPGCLQLGRRCLPTLTPAQGMVGSVQELWGKGPRPRHLERSYESLSQECPHHHLGFQELPFAKLDTHPGMQWARSRWQPSLMSLPALSTLPCTPAWPNSQQQMPRPAALCARLCKTSTWPSLGRRGEGPTGAEELSAQNRAAGPPWQRVPSPPRISGDFGHLFQLWATDTANNKQHVPGHLSDSCLLPGWLTSCPAPEAQDTV